MHKSANLSEKAQDGTRSFLLHVKEDVPPSYIGSYTKTRVPSRATPDNDPDAIGPVTLTLTSLPQKPGDPPASIRLRRLLKTMLRTYGFRASWAEPDEQPHDPLPDKPPNIFD